jgi:uncharacterized protein YjiS (DUF1127 family)
MAKSSFVVDNTIPGLGASDLLRRASSIFSSTYGTLAGEMARARRERQIQRALRGLDAHILRDIGMDRRAC